MAESFEEAFCGRTRLASAASFRAFWWRRWGRSTVDAGGVTDDSELREVFAASIPVVEPSPVPVAVNAPLLEFARALSSSALAEKYSSRNRDVVPVIVLLIFDVPEKFLLAFRTADFALARKHDAHMVDDAFDRKALIGGNRIIIAWSWHSEAWQDFLSFRWPRGRRCWCFLPKVQGQPIIECEFVSGILAAGLI